MGGLVRKAGKPFTVAATAFVVVAVVYARSVGVHYDLTENTDMNKNTVFYVLDVLGHRSRTLYLSCLCLYFPSTHPPPWPTHPFIHPTIYPFTHHPFIHPSIHPSAHPSTHSLTCPFIPFTHPSIIDTHPPNHPPIHSSIQSPIHLSIHPPIYPPPPPPPANLVLTSSLHMSLTPNVPSLPRHAVSASLVPTDSQERLWKLNKTQVGGVKCDVTAAQPARLWTFCFGTMAVMEKRAITSCTWLMLRMPYFLL